MKIVISETETGKSYQTELEKGKIGALLGKKLGEKLEGGLVGAAGYELEITGGSDLSGFPMRKDVSGPRRTDVLLSGGVGYRVKNKGARAKKLVRGNTISDQIYQVNTKVVKKGVKPLEELFPKAAGAKKDEKKK